MAAIQRPRVSSSIGGAFAVAVSAALLVGGTGGYAVRALSSHDSSSAQAPVVRSAPAGEDVTQSDLTRAQPPTAVVPDWVKRYTERPAAQQFKVDELIASLDYAGTASSGSVRTQRAAALPFKLNEVIASVDGAGAAAPETSQPDRSGGMLIP